MEAELTKLKVADLKTLLTNNGLPVSGTKAELVQVSLLLSIPPLSLSCHPYAAKSSMPTAGPKLWRQTIMPRPGAPAHRTCAVKRV